MTKIEAYNNAKRVLEARKALQKQANDTNCDKFGATVTVKDSYAGYYGSSSVSKWGPESEKAVSDELYKLLRIAIGNAVKTAERDVALAKQAAEAEAREVLAGL